MNRIIALTLFLLPAQLFAQQFLDKSTSDVKVALKNDKQKPLITKEDASSLTYTLSNSKPLVTGIISFDENGKCISEQVRANCDSCIKAWLDPLLAKTKYNWKKINENQYVSNFESRLMIELPPDGKLNAYKLMRMNWTRELYELLLK